MCPSKPTRTRRSAPKPATATTTTPTARPRASARKSRRDRQTPEIRFKSYVLPFRYIPRGRSDPVRVIFRLVLVPRTRSAEPGQALEEPGGGYAALAADGPDGGTGAVQHRLPAQHLLRRS